MKGKKPSIALQEMVRNFRENGILVNTVAEGIFMGFSYLSKTYHVWLLCSCHWDKRSDLVLLRQPCKGSCMQNIWTQHGNVASWVNGEHFEMGQENSYSLRHILRTHISFAFLLFQLSISLGLWMLLFVAVFRGYCSCLLEDLFFCHSKEFASHKHSSSLNILKAFKQVGAFKNFTSSFRAQKGKNLWTQDETVH